MSHEPQHTITLLPERRNGVDARRRPLRTASERPAVSRRFWRGVAFGLALTALLAAGVCTIVPRQAHAAELREEYVRVTFYTLPGRMASGAMVHRDAAACSAWMPFGTQLMFADGYVVTCEDRGLGDWYWRGWVDVWAPSMAWGRSNVTGAYGDYTWVSIVRWGWDG